MTAPVREKRTIPPRKEPEMKRLISVLVTIVLLASLGCTAHDPHSGGEEKPEESAGAQASAPADGAAESRTPEYIFVPEWEERDVKGNTVSYVHVTEEQLEGYIKARVEDGFTLMELESAPSIKILFRDGVWIDVSDYTGIEDDVLEPGCELTVSYDRPSEGLDRAEAEQVAAAFDNSVRRLVSLIEVSPEGLYEKSGVGLFNALYETAPSRDGAPARFTKEVLMIGAGSGYNVRFYDAIAADIDGDGANEAVLLASGPTSGLFSLQFEAYGIKDGALTLIGSSAYALDIGLCSLAEHDGKPYLSWEKRMQTVGDLTVYGEPQEFLLSAENGNILIDDPAGSLGTM